ncbi:MAG TPA: hypothetical protein VMR33_13590 [Candidatus Baltobacteraceae bacterium]|nr:hypothetical protein [Candidatus Baltobacteraceae bacterium]
MQADQQINSSTLNFPDFQTLPEGLKQMLLISEAHFCDQPAYHHQDRLPQVKANPRKMPLTFGDFVAGVYHTWGKRRGKGVVQLALKAHVIEFCGTERFVIS